jgi:hypothetical protein
MEIENFLQPQVLGFSLREVVASTLASALGSAAPAPDVPILSVAGLAFVSVLG